MYAAPSKGKGFIGRLISTTWGATKTISKATAATGLALGGTVAGVSAYLAYKTLMGAKYLVNGK